MSSILQSEKDWVIGHKIVDVQTTREHGIRIIMDDGKDILISLVVRPAEIAKTELSAFISPAYHVEIVSQVGIPGKVSDEEQSQNFGNKDAEKEIFRLRNMLQEVCEQGCSYEREVEGKVEQFREFLFSHALGNLGSGLKDKFVEIFGEKVRVICQLCGEEFKARPPTNLFWGLICPECLEGGKKVE